MGSYLLTKSTDMLKYGMMQKRFVSPNGAAGANAEKTMDMFGDMDENFRILAKAMNYFDKSVKGAEGTAQIKEMLKAQFANQLGDVMQNGFPSPTGEKDADGNLIVYTGQDAVDKFMEHAQVALEKQAKDAQWASWQNYDQAQAAKAAKEQAAKLAAMQGSALNALGNVADMLHNMGGSGNINFAPMGNPWGIFDGESMIPDPNAANYPFNNQILLVGKYGGNPIIGNDIIGNGFFAGSGMLPMNSNNFNQQQQQWEGYDNKPYDFSIWKAM
ncbi:MAG: hypothetical protein A2Y33_12660 [Spirochaetes bacterium GWF1_51_8]|nr:MAG: hypothetical protein A2Y33_12660 [Spirochaetes bacterium GWF1_51_8]